MKGLRGSYFIKWYLFGLIFSSAISVKAQHFNRDEDPSPDWRSKPRMYGQGQELDDINSSYVGAKEFRVTVATGRDFVVNQSGFAQRYLNFSESCQYTLKNVYENSVTERIRYLARVCSNVRPDVSFSSTNNSGRRSFTYTIHLKCVERTAEDLVARNADIACIANPEIAACYDEAIQERITESRLTYEPIEPLAESLCSRLR